MKKNELIKIIELVVRKEVKKQMTDIFINEGKKAVLSKSNGGFDVPDVLPKPKEQKTYVKDPVLNNILNETAHSQEMEEYPTMSGETYTTEKMGEVLGSAYSNLGNDTSNPNGTLAAEMGVNAEEPGMEFFKKDFRAVLKAVDKKKAGGPLRGA